MKFLYKYPQAEYPYALLEQKNRDVQRPGLRSSSCSTPASSTTIAISTSSSNMPRPMPEDMCIRIEAFNRGPAPAPLHILPHLWFRNTWAWGPTARCRSRSSALGPLAADFVSLVTDDSATDDAQQYPRSLPPRATHAVRRRRRPATVHLQRDEHGTASTGPAATAASRTSRMPSTAAIVGKEAASTRTHSAPRRRCTTTSRRCRRAGRSWCGCGSRDAAATSSIRRWPRLTASSAKRRAEADEFYDSLHKPGPAPMSGWCSGRPWPACCGPSRATSSTSTPGSTATIPTCRRPPIAPNIRNKHWRHLNSMRVMTMPDKWEYPWFAAWDLAFHCVAFALVDPDYAKDQLWLLLFEQFQHPNGQIPAYEWEFSDLNPPVHAWAVWRVYNMDRSRTGKADRAVPRTLLPQAAHQFRLVDQQGRPRGQQHLRRRLPRPGQHHGRRPQHEQPATAASSSRPTPPAGWACSA